MPKRRRTIGEDDDGDSIVIPKRKRRTMDINELCQELYDTIRNHKTEEGRLLCENFVRVPKKRTCAEYYDVVTTPMDLMKIQQKIKMDEYDDVDQMTADMELMIANAKAFYKKTSPGYRDACAIWDLFNVTKNELLDPTFGMDYKREEELRTPDSDKKDSDQSIEEEESPYEELFSAVMTAADHDGRFLSSMFQLLPSKTRYPEYYKVINDPIDLKMIATKIQNLSYVSLNDMEKDLLLMVKNAKTFNEPGSQIYKDAAQLRKLIVNKKYEIDQRKVQPAKTSERISLIISGGQSTLKSTIRRHPILQSPVSSAGSSTSSSTPTSSSQPTTSCVSRARRLASGQKWSAITAALQYESDSEDFSQGDAAASSVSLVGGITPGTNVQSFVPIAQSSASSSCSSFASAQGTNFSFMAGEDGVEGEEGGNDSGPEDADINPQWQLYETVKNHQAPQGYLLSEPFLRLPSRKLYPDYYREIKHPMSLFKIKTKIKNGGYNSTVEVVDDLNIMFENAKRYNRPDSKLFKDAVKLQKIMQNKARELINSHMKESDSESEMDDLKKKKPKKVINNSPMLVPLKKRMKLLYKTLLDYVDEFNRPLINMFMEKPSRKDYPDYYEVITNPMDMKTIDWNIKNDRYTSEEQILNDFRQMFNNCRSYNEEGSQIYIDADTLENVLNARLRELGPLIDVKPKLVMKRHLDLFEDQMGRGRPPHNEHLYKLRTFFETIKEYTDHRGRKLSTVFLKLPSKNDYPDYYEVIKKPMDLDRIGNKLKLGQYECLEDLLSDVILMFDNACKYNEPDSQIYKDALALQRIALQTKLELNDPEDGVPDVKALVQELLTNIFISVYNHQDEEGRCFSDSLVELAETETSNMDNQMPPQKILTLDIIKRNLDRGRYRRLEMFQEEMFEVFERARMVSRTDSQAFEDSVELQSFFIKTRDELTKNGQVLQSPALHYTEADLQTSVNNLRAEKLPNEQLDPEGDRSQLGKEEEEGDSGSNSLSMRGQTYHIGDFVYVEPREKGMEPHIIHIEKLWRDDQNEPWISGCWFYRPIETFHLAHRKFLQQEVFKSDNYNSTPLSQVIGHCFVMFVKDYFKFKPEGFEDKDVYVCESRYSAKAKAFKKIKTSWRITPSDNVSIIPRSEPLEPVRIPSAFKDGVERPKEDSLDLDDGDMTIIDKPKPNIVCDVESPEEGAIYYEQFTLPTELTVRVGDCCYVRTEGEKSLIARIDKMWLDKNQNAYFHGPWFVTPQEIYHSTTRLFYKQEVFLSTIEDTNPLLSIVGRCSVLDLKDYSTLRPTEIPEDDVYVCEARYFEAERQIRKFPKGLKKFLLAPDVMEDEVYYFRKPINPQKTEVFSSSVEVKTPGECTPINPDTENEESLDMPPPSIASKEDSNMSTSTPVTTTGKKVKDQKKSMKKLVTGYIMFAGDVRKGVIQANPDRSFGDISRMIGTEWRNLPEGKKTDYEQRAQRQNEELTAALAKEREKEGYDSYPQSPASSHGGGNSNHGTSTPSNPVDENTVYECLWDGCDCQFEEMQDLVDHLLMDTNSKGHIYQTYPNPKTEKDKGEKSESSQPPEYQCLWQNCSRIKRNIPPFTNIQRLLRHCKEVHLKAAAKIVLPENRSKNFVPSRKHASSPAVSSTPATVTPKGYNSYLNPAQSASAMGSGASGNLYSNIPFTPVPLHNHNLNNSHHQLGPNHSPYIQQQLNSGTVATVPFQPVKAPDPIFVATPPKPQRLLHSNTYIKYIESLQPESRYVGDWDHQLKATIDNTPNYDSQRLPANWLTNGSVNHGNVINALWALRNYMMRDALGISKIG